MFQSWYGKILIGLFILVIIIASFIFISRIQLERKVLAERDELYESLGNGKDIILDEDASRLKCVGEIIDYTEVDGIKIPHKVNVSWIEAGEKFTWYKIENYNIVFDDFAFIQ